MKEIIAKLYEITPKHLLRKLSGKKKMRFLKNVLLRNKNGYKIIPVTINRNYHSYNVSFVFFAPIKIAIKAKKRGIENTLLRHSFELLSKYKPESNLNIYDVGANYGFLSMVWAKALESNQAKLYSFEPSPTVSEVTHKSFSMNKLNIKLFKKAVGNMNGNIDLYDGLSSSNVSTHEGSKKVRVEITSLDQFTFTEKINKVDLIKIDVDGIEYDILQGAKEIILNYKPILIVETNNDIRIIEFIKSIDYIILDMKLEKVDVNSEIIPPNIFCLESEIYKDNKIF
jgi:FkbM family methyltransferase